MLRPLCGMLSFGWLALARGCLPIPFRELIPSGSWQPAGSMEPRALTLVGGLEPLKRTILELKNAGSSSGFGSYGLYVACYPSDGLHWRLDAFRTLSES